MPKPHKVDFQSLIATEVAPAIAAEKNAPALAQIIEHPAKREGTLKQRTRQQSLYLEIPVYEVLREVAFTERRSMQSLFLEGLDAVLKSRGLPSIKELLKPSVMSSQDEMTQ